MFRFLLTLVLVLASFFKAALRYFVPVEKKDLNGKTVLITGGGGGLGKELAVNFAKCGARIVLWDIDEESNKRTALLVNALKADAFAYKCDCTNEDEVKEIAAKVQDEIGHVDILVNNAGILHGKSITMLTENQIRKTFNVNVLAHFWTIKAFLPAMMTRNEGHIVTISSSAGLNGTAYLTDYASSKFALVGMHEALFLELREQGFHHIQMTCICPNFINTGMSWYPKTNVPWLLPILQPNDVAQDVVDAVREDKELVVLPSILGKLVAGKRLLPHSGQLTIYDYLGLGIEPHIWKKKTKRTSNYSSSKKKE